MGEVCWQCPDFEALPEQKLSFVEHLPYIAAKAATLQLVNRERKNVNKIQAIQHGGESCLGRRTRRADFLCLTSSCSADSPSPLSFPQSSRCSKSAGKPQLGGGVFQPRREKPANGACGNDFLLTVFRSIQMQQTLIYTMTRYSKTSKSLKWGERQCWFFSP